MNLVNMTSLIKIKAKAPAGPKYWRSLDQLSGTPKFRQWMENEFPTEAGSLLDDSSRRTVLKMMAASFGLAGLTACRRPVEHIFPISHGIDNYVPGDKYLYTTVISLAGQSAGLVVETHDGRPTKIEGNPQHPFSQGAATALAQASLLNLYDPDRSWKVLEDGKDSTWDKFEAFIKALPLGDGAGLRFLSESVTSPSLTALRTSTLKKFPKAKWVEYEAFQRTEGRLGATLAFGEPVAPKPISTRPRSSWRSIPIFWAWIGRRLCPPSSIPRAAVSPRMKIWTTCRACTRWRANSP